MLNDSRSQRYILLLATIFCKPHRISLFISVRTDHLYLVCCIISLFLYAKICQTHDYIVELWNLICVFRTNAYTTHDSRFSSSHYPIFLAIQSLFKVWIRIFIIHSLVIFTSTFQGAVHIQNKKKWNTIQQYWVFLSTGTHL